MRSRENEIVPVEINAEIRLADEAARALPPPTSREYLRNCSQMLTMFSALAEQVAARPAPSGSDFRLL